MRDDGQTKPETQIVSLLHPCADPVHRGLDEFAAYWRSMCQDGDIPRRSDIDPRKIDRLLPNTFILERVAPGLARLRIAGTHLSDLLGMEVRGMPVSALFEPSDREDLAQHIVHLFDEPATIRISLSSKGYRGSKPLNGSMLLMPLRSDLGDVSRAIGCFISGHTSIRAPHRFGISDCKVTPVNCETNKLRVAHVVRKQEISDSHQQCRPRLSGERSYLKLVPNG